MIIMMFLNNVLPVDCLEMINNRHCFRFSSKRRIIIDEEFRV